jgi:CRISPR type III-A-associated protein Csm2
MITRRYHNQQRPTEPRSRMSLDLEYWKVTSYFDSKGNLLPDMIQKWPEQLANDFRYQQPKLTSTQLRRFFNRARNLEREYKARKRETDSEQEFDRLKEDILIMKVLAAAAIGRKTAPELFKRFIDKNVALAVESEYAFTRGFLTHLQSVVAYLKYFEEKEKGR